MDEGRRVRTGMIFPWSLREGASCSCRRPRSTLHVVGRNGVLIPCSPDGIFLKSLLVPSLGNCSPLDWNQWRLPFLLFSASLLGPLTLGNCSPLVTAQQRLFLSLPQPDFRKGPPVCPHLARNMRNWPPSRLSLFVVNRMVASSHPNAWCAL